MPVENGQEEIPGFRRERFDLEELVVVKGLDVGLNTPFFEIVVELGKIVKHKGFITRAVGGEWVVNDCRAGLLGGWD